MADDIWEVPTDASIMDSLIKQRNAITQDRNANSDVYGPWYNPTSAGYESLKNQVMLDQQIIPRGLASAAESVRQWWHDLNDRARPLAEKMGNGLVKESKAQETDLQGLGLWGSSGTRTQAQPTSTAANKSMLSATTRLAEAVKKVAATAEKAKAVKTAQTAQTAQTAYAKPPQPTAIMQPSPAEMFNIDTGQVNGYIPPVEQDGRFITDASKQAFLPGAPINMALARVLMNENARDQQAYAASMGGARQHQLIASQNDPQTYAIAQQFMANGMPADRALHSAMTQRLAQQGNYLGLGASLPAAQRALDETNNSDAALAMMFGVPYTGQATGGSYNISPTGIRSFTVNNDGTASVSTHNGVVEGMSGPTASTALAFANRNPASQWMLNTLAGGSPGQRYSAASNGTPAQISSKADQAIKDAAKRKTGAGAQGKVVPYGA